MREKRTRLLCFRLRTPVSSSTSLVNSTYMAGEGRPGGEAEQGLGWGMPMAGRQRDRLEQTVEMTLGEVWGAFHPSTLAYSPGWGRSLHPGRRKASL